MAKKLLLLFAVVGLWAACKNKPAEEKKLYNGFVVWEENYTTFTDCSTGKEYWLQDPTGQIAAKAKQLATQPYQQIFFTLEGEFLPPATQGMASTFDNIFSATNVVNAQKNAPENTCAVKGDKPVFKCQGEQPHWELSFASDIRFEAEYPTDTLVFFPITDAQVRDSAGVGKVFYYNVGNENFQNIEIIVTEATCQTKSGKVRRFTSKVILGETIYNGCAELKTSTEKHEEHLMPSTSSNPSGGM